MHRYLQAGPDCPTFVGDSEWHPIVDGRAYFAELAEQLAGLGAGDEVLVAGLELDPDLRLDPDGPRLPDQLEALAAAGVDVRVLLAGKVSASFLPLPGLTGFRANAALCRRLNAAPGMGGHALVDFSGPYLGSNHQKTVVVTRAGVVTAYVGGIDLVAERRDAGPHDTLRLEGERWGWHDAAVRLRGPAAGHAHDVLVGRWHEAATLPAKPRLDARRMSWPLPRINPHAAADPEPAAAQQAVDAPGTSVRVLRSISSRKADAVLPSNIVRWDALPVTGVQEIFRTLSLAIGAAQRYVYLEDQYLHEYAGGRQRFLLYPYLRKAAARGVKIILVGSGRRDPDDPGVSLHEINSTVNRDLRRRLLAPLEPQQRDNVAVYRVEHLTVHSKLLLIDDTFANIGSANLFSRSMSGVDCEISAAVETSTDLVRDLRVQVWAEHLRSPLSPELTADLVDLDLALGIWDPGWLPRDRPATAWQLAGQPASFRPAERVLTRVDRH